AATTTADPSVNTTEHGRGICLMRSLMDDVSYRRGGSEVRLRKLRDFLRASSKSRSEFAITSPERWEQPTGPWLHPSFASPVFSDAFFGAPYEGDADVICPHCEMTLVVPLCDATAFIESVLQERGRQTAIGGNAVRPAIGPTVPTRAASHIR